MTIGLPFLLTVAAPTVGWAGLVAREPWLMWVGAALCALVLFLDYASGALRGLPILSALCVGLGAFWAPAWYVGAAKGLILWSTLSALGEIYGIVKARSGAPS